jgi:hypothetical protein
MSSRDKKIRAILLSCYGAIFALATGFGLMFNLFTPEYAEMWWELLGAWALGFVATWYWANRYAGASVLLALAAILAGFFGYFTTAIGAVIVSTLFQVVDTRRGNARVAYLEDRLLAAYGRDPRPPAAMP